MTEAEQFAKIDAYEGNTMVVFSDRAVADRYIVHRAYAQDQFGKGLIALVEDTREKTGLCVLWRDPIPADKLDERLANCRWLLEEVLAGRRPGPVAGEVTELWSGGFTP